MRPAPAAPERRAGTLSPLVLAAFAVGFSPVLLDLAAHLAAHPWARAALVAPLLAWLTAQIDRPDAPPAHGRRLALAALAAALLLQLVAIGGDAIRLARVGVAVAAALALWGSGRAGWRTSLLVLAMLPVPSLVLELSSPQLEGLLGRLAALVPGIGSTVVDGTPRLHTAGGHVVLGPLDGGLALAAGLGVLAWARAILIDRTVSRACGHVAAAFALAIPLQLALLVLAAGPVAAMAGDAGGRAVLDHASWLIVLTGGLVLAGGARGAAS